MTPKKNGTKEKKEKNGLEPAPRVDGIVGRGMMGRERRGRGEGDETIPNE